MVTRFAVKKMDSGLEPGLDWNLARQRQWEFQGPRVMGPSHTISIRIPLILLLMGEIRSSPVEVGSLSNCLQGFVHPKWCSVSSISSMLNVYGIREYVGICPHQKIDECFTKK